MTLSGKYSPTVSLVFSIKRFTSSTPVEMYSFAVCIALIAASLTSC